MLEDPDEAPDDSDPVLLFAESILATARSLHELISGYDGLVERLTRVPSDHAARASHSSNSHDYNIPF